MATRVEYGVVDGTGELILVPGPDSDLKSTVKDLPWLLRLFGSQGNIVKVTFEDVISQPDASTSESQDMPQIPTDPHSA